MTNTRFIVGLFTLTTLLASKPVLAESVEASEDSALRPRLEDSVPRPRSPEAEGYRWGVETESVQPFLPTIGIIRLRLTRTLWGTVGGVRGDLVVGAYIRPNIEHDIVDRIHEYMGVVGYRQFFWKGAHIEALVNAGAAWGKNLFDGKDYKTATVFVEGNLGYRFAFFEPGGFYANPKGSVGFFVMPQVGVISTVGIADIGPRNGKTDVFPQATLLAGASW